MSKANYKKKQIKSRSLLPLAAILGGAAVVGILVIVGIIAGAKALLARENPVEDQAAALPLEISVAEASAQRDAGAFILDVREQEEWEAVHIPGATLIPLGQLETRLAELPTDQNVVVVCRSGNRSATGRDILLENGFTQVTSMAGGMNEWAAAGYETAAGK